MHPPATPVVSVVLPAYNAEQHVGEAVESILSQSFRDFELIAIDDGSQDGTLGILEHFASKDARVRIVSRPNKGLVRTLNEGLSLARGKYVARMDADDISEKERFKLQVEFLDAHPEVVLLGVRTFPSRRMKWRYIGRSNPEFCTWGLLFRNKLGHPGVMFRAELIQEHGLKYREEYLFAEDFKLWCEMVEYGKAHVLPNRLLFYRQHDASISKKNALEQLRVDRRIVSENLMRAFQIDMSDVLDASPDKWIQETSRRVFTSKVFRALPSSDQISIHQTFQDFCAIYGARALFGYLNIVGYSRLLLSGAYMPSTIYRTIKHSLRPRELAPLQ